MSEEKVLCPRCGGWGASQSVKYEDECFICDGTGYTGPPLKEAFELVEKKAIDFSRSRKRKETSNE